MNKSDALIQALDAIRQSQTHTHRMLDELEANHRVLWDMVQTIKEDHTATPERLHLLENRMRDLEQMRHQPHDFTDALYFLKQANREALSDRKNRQQTGKKAILKRLFASSQPV